MKKIIDVQTGELNTGKEEVILRSAGIGSCVVIAAYDPGKKTGALAHVMLPGCSPADNASQKTRYAADAVEEMISRMAQLGTDMDDLEVILVGGGNVLKRDDDTICDDNIKSVIDILTKKGIRIKAKSVGGTVRRTVSLDIEKGRVYCTEGDSAERLLWITGR